MLWQRGMSGVKADLFGVMADDLPLELLRGAELEGQLKER